MRLILALLIAAAILCACDGGIVQNPIEAPPQSAPPVVTPTPFVTPVPVQTVVPQSTSTPAPINNLTAPPSPEVTPSAIVSSTPSPAVSATLLPATPAPPFDPRTLRAPSSLRAPSILADAAPGPSPTPTDITSNLGQFGTSWLDSSELGVYANLTVYAQGEVQLPYDAGYLYAPTIHGSGGDCNENPIKYLRWFNDPSTRGSLVVYDFCSPGGPAWTAVDIPLDDAFLRDYVRDFGHGPQYTTEHFQTSPGTWAVYIYNYTMQAWRSIYTSSNAGVTIGGWGWGWTLFEPHLRPSPTCPAMPPVYVNDITVYDAKLGWQLVTQDYVDKSAGRYFQSAPSPFGSCEVGDAAVWKWAFPPTLNAWGVISK